MGRGVAACLLAALALLCVVAPAEAGSITLSVGESPAVQDKPVAISATGDSSGSFLSSVQVTAKPAGPGVACAPTARADSGTSVIYDGSPDQVFSLAETFTFPTPGEWLLCGWVEDRAGTATTSLAVSVRAPQLALRVTGASRLRRNRPARFTFRVAAEVPRDLLYTFGRVSSCNRSYEAASQLTDEYGGSFEVSGVASETVSLRFPRLGTWRVCAFLQRDGDDAVAEAVAQRVVRVVRTIRRRR